MFVLSLSRAPLSPMVNGLFPIGDSDVADIAVRSRRLPRVMVAVVAICSLVMFLRYQRHD